MKQGWSSCMERRVKERLVGATVLVVLVVLIVPELLSGPQRTQLQSSSAPGAADAVRSVTVDLSTDQATVGPDEAASAATSAVAVAPPSSPAPAEGTPRVHVGSATAVASHGWAAQLGSFSTRINAEKLERLLRAQGFAASVTSSASDEPMRYRVRVGPLADRGAAEKVVAKLKKAGHPASIVAL